MKFLVTPRCCEQMLKTPCIYLALDNVYEEGGDDNPPRWKMRAFTTWDNIKAGMDGEEQQRINIKHELQETSVEAKACPFCGTPVPTIVPRDTTGKKICKITDGGYYCDTCNERLMACRCYPPEWNWQPGETPIMSYAIGNIVYGIDASESSQLLQLVEEWLEENEDLDVDEIAYTVEDMQDADNFREHWCKSYYSAGGPEPAVFGVELGKIDECTNVSIDRIAEIGKVKGTDKLEYTKKYNRLPESLRSKIEQHGIEPMAFVLWSSS